MFIISLLTTVDKMNQYIIIIISFKINMCFLIRRDVEARSYHNIYVCILCKITFFQLFLE